MRRPRAFTLLELMVATVTVTMVAGAVAGFLGTFHRALRLQDVRAAAIVRTAAVQAHVSRLLLESRMVLEQGQQRTLLWLPSEMLEDSGSGSESAFDLINLTADELHWLLFEQEADGSWSLKEAVVNPATIPAGQGDRYFTVDAAYWNSVFEDLRAAGQLTIFPIAEGLAPMARDGVVAAAPQFTYGTTSICTNRSLGVEFAFMRERLDDAGDPTGEEELRLDVRLDEHLPFPDVHPICGGGS
ncbi:MAG: type II secretion system protein [Phycisphaerae bacterium]|nr:type II secretion system protein [Phycisphaerae bacterium]